ncbi:hypothetical protein Scep_006341 [Stephania cephalantha]|uniref:EF-hand domain-containing protein n=1 Tax=Stephania cephalantha TaxID=152367 RepID=A0AAP0K9D3_9MAGN
MERLWRWVSKCAHQIKFKALPKKGKPKKTILSNGFDWIASSFTSMEVSTQLKQVFKLIDANGDGKISPIELGEVLLCLGHERGRAAEEAEGMVSEVDCNGDGFIDLDEFMEVVGGGKNDELMDAFMVFDCDKNGFISAKELRRVLVSLGHDECTLKECKLMIRGVDRDGDGQVSFEEFRSMMMGFGAFGGSSSDHKLEAEKSGF